MKSSYLIDTNVLSEVSKPTPDSRVLDWLKSVRVHQLSVITVGELRKGFHLLPIGRRRIEVEAFANGYLLREDVITIPVTEQIAARWGELTALQHRMGKPLPFADGLIAATALEYDLTLATRNTRDFTGIGLRLFNPWLDNPEQEESRQ